MPDDLEELGHKIDEIEHKKQAEKDRLARALDSSNAMVRGIRAGAELVTPIIAGGGFGWLVDHWLGTKPAFLIILLLLGVVTGFVNVWRMSQDLGAQVGFSELHRRKKDGKTSPTESE